MTRYPAQLARNVSSGQNKLHISVSCAEGRAGGLGSALIVGKGDAAGLPNRLQAQAAIAVVAGKYHSNGHLFQFVRQGTEEPVDRQVRTPRRTPSEAQAAISYAHFQVLGNDVQTVWLQGQPFFGLVHGQSGGAGKQLDPDALMC